MDDVVTKINFQPTLYIYDVISTSFHLQLLQSKFSTPQTKQTNRYRFPIPPHIQPPRSEIIQNSSIYNQTSHLSNRDKTLSLLLPLTLSHRPPSRYIRAWNVTLARERKKETRPRQPRGSGRGERERACREPVPPLFLLFLHFLSSRLFRARVHADAEKHVGCQGLFQEEEIEEAGGL